MFENIENSIYEYMLKEHKEVKIQDMFIERFWSNAVCGVLKEWVLNYPDETSENLAKYICKVVL